MKKDFMVLSCAPQTDGGGIYLFSTDGQVINKTSYYALDYPMYAALDGEKQYVILRAPYSDNKNSAVAVLKDFKQTGELISTQGEVACHLSVKNGIIYAANYISGSVFSSGNKLVRHSGKGINLPRQDKAHCHFAGAAHGYIFAVDLGIDTIFMYDENLKLISSAKVPSGYGARHLAFSQNGGFIYCVNELVSSVSILKLSGAELEYIDTVLCPVESGGQNFAAAIRLIDDELLIISNRGDDNLCSFNVSGDKITFRQSIGCGGSYPRDFNISKDKRHIICTNEKSDNITLFEIKNKNIEHIFTLDGIKNPLAVEFM